VRRGGDELFCDVPTSLFALQVRVLAMTPHHLESSYLLELRDRNGAVAVEVSAGGSVQQDREEDGSVVLREGIPGFDAAHVDLSVDAV
jgi:hypothetical protein